MPVRKPPRSLAGVLGGGALTTATAAATVVSTLTGYLALLSVRGSVAGRRRPAPAASAMHHRFAILIPAHDEAAGIARALATMQAMDYPDRAFEVHVVADNCTDATAHVVRSCGVEVHERHDLDDPGKGSALNWLHDRLIERG